jgi:hypothetical protein
MFDPTLASSSSTYDASSASYSRNVQPLIDRDGCPADFNIMAQPLKEIHSSSKNKNNAKRRSEEHGAGDRKSSANSGRYRRAAELILAGGKKRRAPGPGPHTTSSYFDGRDSEIGKHVHGHVSNKGNSVQHTHFEESRLYSSFKVQQSPSQ